MSKKLVMFGNGEMAEIAFYYFSHDSDYEVVAFCIDDIHLKGGEKFKDLPLISFSKVTELYPPDQYVAHVALSYNKLNSIREEKYNAMKDKGYKLISYVCSKSVTWPDLSVGDNCLILENQTIQPTVQIGNNVMIWSGNHLGHKSHIGDHTYISSHVCISGYTIVGRNCFFGVNSTTKDQVKIGDSVFVAMGAMVTKDISSGAIVVGAQGDVFEAESKIAKKIKKKYFNI